MLRKFLTWVGDAGDVWAAIALFGTGLMAAYALARAYLSWPLESQIAMAIAIGLAATRIAPPIGAAVRMIAIAIGQKFNLPVRSIPLLSEAETIADQLRTATIKDSEGNNKPLSRLFLALGSQLAIGLGEYWNYREIEVDFSVTNDVANEAMSELIIHRVVRRENMASSRAFTEAIEYGIQYSLTELGAETLRVLRERD